MRKTCHASSGRSVLRFAIAMFSLTNQAMTGESRRVPRAIPVNTRSSFNSIRRINFEDTVFLITSASTTLSNERLFPCGWGGEQGIRSGPEVACLGVSPALGRWSGPFRILQIPPAAESLVKLDDDRSPVQLRKRQRILRRVQL